MKKIIHLLKYDRRYEIGFILGKKLALEFKNLNIEFNCPAKNIYILPVPIHKKREKVRGYNQSIHIANGFLSIYNYTLLDNLIKRTKNTISQTSLSKEERLKNVKNIFKLNYEILAKIPKNSIFIIIDDIITTGATTSSMENILTKAGYKNHFSLAIATSARQISHEEYEEF